MRPLAMRGASSLRVPGLPARATIRHTLGRPVTAAQIRNFRFRWTGSFDPDVWQRHRNMWRKYIACRSHADESFIERQAHYRRFVDELKKMGFKDAAEQFERELQRDETELEEALGSWARKNSGYSRYMGIDPSPRTLFRGRAETTKTEEPGSIRPDKPSPKPSMESVYSRYMLCATRSRTLPTLLRGRAETAKTEEAGSIRSARPIPKSVMETCTSSGPIESESYIDPVTNRRITRNISKPASEKETPSSHTPEEAGQPTTAAQGSEKATTGTPLTGNYARDRHFPEKAPGSWNKRVEIEGEPDIASMDESFPPLGPALDPSASQAKKSHRPEDLKPTATAGKETVAAVESVDNQGSIPAVANREEPVKAVKVEEEPAQAQTSNTIEESLKAVETPLKTPAQPSRKIEEEPIKSPKVVENKAVRAPETVKEDPVDCLEQQIKDIYEGAYGKIEQKPVLSSSLKPSPKSKTETPPPEPTKEPGKPSVYKILVVDPTTQQVNMADAMSIAEDNAAPLTIGEVMQRISNPSRFFPHFGTLQAQGYEIVSGSGDVLVFRKVREASSPGTAFVRETSEPGSVFLRGATMPSNTKVGAEHGKARPRPVNPIDMMGSTQPATTPNIGNFTNPTGYVNYDTPPPEQVRSKPPPPFRSGIDVRREEEVFSGPKQKPKKKGQYKWKLLSATSVFAFVYWVTREKGKPRESGRPPPARHQLETKISQLPPPPRSVYDRRGERRGFGPPVDEKRSNSWW